MNPNRIPVETSARHIHLSKSDLEKLFGKGFELQRVRDLSQPGEFLSSERLAIVGPKDKISHVAVLGPLREKTQVEISLTDARKLGIEAPIRESGDLENSAPCILEGPNGKLELFSGVIVPYRHLHLGPKEAAELNLKNGESISVKIPSENRSLIFSDVLVRVKENFSLALHLDTDEANAAGISGKNTIFGEIVK